MNMSKAAIAPRQPLITEANRKHPLFPLYQQHLTFCNVNLIEASRFGDWLYQYERNLIDAAATRHAEYPAFMAWMRENQGGARRCPAGAFPHNFEFWRNGGRW